MAESATVDIETCLAVPLTFQPTNQVLYYNAMGFENLRLGEPIVAETRFGPQIGWVRRKPFFVPNSELSNYKLLKRAEANDIRRYYQLREKARQDMEFVRKKVREHELPMRLLEAEYPLDENQLVVYFAAEGRVDFRDLVADLKYSFPKRVMLFQIGARDAIRTIGAIGPCGRPSCCSLFLRSFESVTMKMAKEQMLDLNPSRLLGACGKLKCCLRYEHDLYCELLSRLPKIGQWVETPKGKGQVADLNVLLMKVAVTLEDGGYGVWNVTELLGYEAVEEQFASRICSGCNCANSCYCNSDWG
ncbi:MAG: stage 0 sporulation protein [Armatimonadetes bacterium]|nr:stage 0 sporulation protein [Armatimonadota bacterium]MDW8026804.1 regulatory iron-sulfur-containing complex subunit RicT [Armatimonadota bacterium]